MTRTKTWRWLSEHPPSGTVHTEIRVGATPLWGRPLAQVGVLDQEPWFRLHDGITPYKRVSRR